MHKPVYKSHVARDPTYRNSMRSTELLLQTIRVCLRSTRLVRIVKADNTAEAEEGHNESAELEETFASRDVGILLGTENAQNFVLFVNWFAEVTSLLLIPPVAIGVSEGTLHTGRVLVAAIL